MLPRASTKAAMGPLPLPEAVHQPPGVVDHDLDRAHAVDGRVGDDVDEMERPQGDSAFGRYSSWNLAHRAVGATSPVLVGAALHDPQNSICRRRGSQPCSTS